MLCGICGNVVVNILWIVLSTRLHSRHSCFCEHRSPTHTAYTHKHTIFFLSLLCCSTYKTTAITYVQNRSLHMIRMNMANTTINFGFAHLFLIIFFLQLPDLRNLDCRVDFSTNTFKAVVHLCKDLGIRHPEELSLCKPLEPTHLKRNYSEYPKRKLPVNELHENGKDYIAPAADTNSFIPTYSTNFHSSNGSLDAPTNGTFSCAPVHTQTFQRSQKNGQPISSPTGVSLISL